MGEYVFNEINKHDNTLSVCVIEMQYSIEPH